MDSRLKAHADTFRAKARPLLERGATVLELEQLILAGYNAMTHLGWGEILALLEKEGTP